MSKKIIQMLSGDALRRSFIEMAFPHAISGGLKGPYVAVEVDGTVKIFVDGSDVPKIEIVSPEMQQSYAMKKALQLKATFEVEEGVGVASCSNGEYRAEGVDYFEAAMRLFLMQVFDARYNDEDIPFFD